MTEPVSAAGRPIQQGSTLPERTPADLEAASFIEPVQKPRPSAHLLWFLRWVAGRGRFWLEAAR